MSDDVVQPLIMSLDWNVTFVKQKTAKTEISDFSDPKTAVFDR